MFQYPAHILGLTAVLAVLPGCFGWDSGTSSSPSEPIPEMTIRVEGTVISETTGLPIPDAEVQVTTHGGSTVLCIPVREHLGSALQALTGLGMIVAWGPSCPFSIPTHTDQMGRFSITQKVRETTPANACVNGYVLVANAPGHDPVTVEPPSLSCTEDLQTIDFVLVGNGAPILAAPGAGAMIDQNIGDLGCENPPYRGGGLRIQFEWVGTAEPLEGPFRIRLRRPQGGRVLIDDLVEGSQYVFTSCGYIGDDDLGGWEWSVRLEADGVTGSWEGPRSLHFQPCRLHDGTQCRTEAENNGGPTDDGGSISLEAPGLLSPSAAALIPQNVGLTTCTAGSTYGSGYRVTFDWSDSGGVFTTYRLYVRHRTANYPLVDRLVVGSGWAEARCAFVADHNLQDWYWRVRVESPAVVGNWSEDRPFEFEPCRVDDGRPCYAAAEAAVQTSSIGDTP